MISKIWWWLALVVIASPSIVGASAAAAHDGIAGPGTAHVSSVWGWGENGVDEFGANRPVAQDGCSCLPPVRVRGLRKVVQVSAGYGFSLAVDSNGRVWMAGDNRHGIAGNGTVGVSGCMCIRRFHPVSGLNQITAVSAGNSEAAALRSDGTVWTWGSNGSGQLGLGYVSSSGCQCVARPHRVPGLRNIRSVSVSGVMLALSWTGRVWTWGAGGGGTLGINRIPHNKCVCIDHPAQVYQITKAVAAEVGNYGNTALAVLADGRVKSWGRDTLATKSRLDPSCGIPTAFYGCVDHPVSVYHLRNVKAVSSGFASLALLKSGVLMAWGHDYEGEAGTGYIEGYIQFPVRIAPRLRFVAIAAAGDYGSALTVGHRVYNWGGCEYGEIGDGGSCGEGRGDPTPTFICDHVSQLSAGVSHELVMRSSPQSPGICRPRPTNPQD